MRPYYERRYKVIIDLRGDSYPLLVLIVSFTQSPCLFNSCYTKIVVEKGISEIFFPLVLEICFHPLSLVGSHMKN